MLKVLRVEIIYSQKKQIHMFDDKKKLNLKNLVHRPTAAPVAALNRRLMALQTSYQQSDSIYNSYLILTF